MKLKAAPPPLPSGLRIKENKEVYEGEVTELTPEYTEAAAAGQGAGAGYGKVRAGGCMRGGSTEGVKTTLISQNPKPTSVASSHYPPP